MLFIYFWNGQADTLETSIANFEGHVDQQQHMSYLLTPLISKLWLKHGDYKVVLCLGRQRSNHPGIHYITSAQFSSDISWLFGALKQSLWLHGKELVRQHESTRDGLVVWKAFLDSYCYNGSIDVYLALQQEVLCTRYSPDYPGGPLAFSEAYDAAFINMDNVSPEPLLSDTGKRQAFLLNFALTAHTADLADLLEHNTSTWSEMMDYLRTSLARRAAVASREARQHAHLATSGPTFPVALRANATYPMPSDPAVQLFINTARTSDLHVSTQLWNFLSSDRRKTVLSWIKEARQSDSGGDSQSKEPTPIKTLDTTNQTALPFPTSDTIVKPPSKKSNHKPSSPNNIPMQYSGNLVHQPQAADSDSDEDAISTVMYVMQQLNAKAPNITRANMAITSLSHISDSGETGEEHTDDDEDPIICNAHSFHVLTVTSDDETETNSFQEIATSNRFTNTLQPPEKPPYALHPDDDTKNHGIFDHESISDALPYATHSQLFKPCISRNNS